MILLLQVSACACALLFAGNATEESLGPLGSALQSYFSECVQLLSEAQTVQNLKKEGAIVRLSYSRPDAHSPGLSRFFARAIAVEYGYTRAFDPLIRGGGEPFPTLSPRTFQSLCRLESLGEVQIGGSWFGDKELRLLCSRKSLRVLRTVNTHITDQGLMYVARISNLEELCIENAHGVTRGGLHHLQALCGLKELRVTSWAVGDGGAAVISLRRALPRTRVSVGAFTLSGEDNGLIESALRDARVRWPGQDTRGNWGQSLKSE